MSKIYTYEIIKDTYLPLMYWEDFWESDIHYMAKSEAADQYIREKAKIDSEYFVFALDTQNPYGSYSYYTVSKTENNEVDFYQDDYGDYRTYTGVYALKKSDFNNDLEKAFDFAKGEIDYLNELNDSYFNEIRFSAYEYDQETQKYVLTNDFIDYKLIQAHDLEEIMQEKDLTLKEKLIKIVRNENILDGDKLDEFDFLEDANSIVMSENMILELPQELHPFIDKGLTQREKDLEQQQETLIEKKEKNIEEKPLNSQDYWVVEFNEALPEGGVKDYKGELITKELVDELKKLDERVHKEKPEWVKEEEDGRITLIPIPYFKFYFNHIKNGEVIDDLRIDIGDGNEFNEKYFQHLYEQTNKECITDNNQEEKSEQQQEQKRAKRLRM